MPDQRPVAIANTLVCNRADLSVPQPRPMRPLKGERLFEPSMKFSFSGQSRRFQDREGAQSDSSRLDQGCSRVRRWDRCESWKPWKDNPPRVKQALDPTHGRASPDLDQSFVQKGSERSLINALEGLVDSASGGRVHPFSAAIVTSWDLHMRWDFQHQCSISLLSACLGHRNNSARATLMAPSCYLHCNRSSDQ